MPPQMNCPVCGSDMRTKSLFLGGGFKPYRVCPDCRSEYTTDKKTKKRAVLIAIYSLMTAVLSVAAFLAGFPFGLFVAAAGAGLLVFVGYTLSRMRYVEYRNKK